MNLISVALYFDAVFRNIVVQMFLDHGADIHLKNKAGETATSLARGRSRTNIMELLEDIGWVAEQAFLQPAFGKMVQCLMKSTNACCSAREIPGQSWCPHQACSSHTSRCNSSARRISAARVSCNSCDLTGSVRAVLARFRC
eukprot:m.338744 g.338744  ORF g.338744 m.338744 type:complete len:142 (-) comp55737_c0_seq8:257-682(-)